MNQGIDQGNGGAMQNNGPGEKNPTVAWLLWFFLGGFGAHRMYMGKMGSGIGMAGLWFGSFVGMFVLIGFVGFAALAGWWVFDAFQINKWCKGEGQFSGQSAGQDGFSGMTPVETEPPMSNAA